MHLPDPRSFGSGNPGATNVLRSGRKTAAALTLLGDALKGWAAIHDKIGIWDYSVHFGNYMQPWPSFHAIAENLRAYAQNNVVGVMIQGAYQSPGNERELMRSWVFAKLLWDPDRECWPLMQDFIHGFMNPVS